MTFPFQSRTEFQWLSTSRRHQVLSSTHRPSMTLPYGVSTWKGVSLAVVSSASEMDLVDRSKQSRHFLLPQHRCLVQPGYCARTGKDTKEVPDSTSVTVESASAIHKLRIPDRLLPAAHFPSL